jgi:hypothetical protein
MMEADLHRAEDAGRLLSYALSPTRSVDTTHRELLRRYRTEGDLRSVVDAFARGLRLRVLDALDHGLVLAADAESPFAFKLADFRQNLSVEDRLCHGMIQIAIAAWCFPTAAALEDDDRGLIAITAHDVVEYLRAACTELQRRAAIDPHLARPELQEAWAVVLSRPETRDTGDGRRATSALTGMVGFALERLAQEGMLRKDGEERGGRWHVRPAWRTQVRELASHEAFRLVTSIHRERA